MQIIDSTDATLIPTDPVPLGRRLLAVAWLSIGLGLAVELVLVVVAATYGKPYEPKPLIAEAAQKVSWSMLICVGLALGPTAARRIHPVTFGLLGLLSAPIAFLIAKLIHRSVSLGFGLELAAGPSPVNVALLRALEYGFLGLAAGWLSSKLWAGIRVHVALGLLTGTIFGGILFSSVLKTATASPPLSHLAALAINELLYPAGCAAILFVSSSLGPRLATMPERLLQPSPTC
jgi:hypothetical protein